MRLLLFLIPLFCCTFLFSQDVIFLENPSFEDTPAFSRPPMGWYYCGQSGESPPDIHPGGFFEVDMPPFDGNTYVGMVIRDNGTGEGLGQRLPAPMQQGVCYNFSIYAARSEDYWSYSRITGEPANYNQAVRLRVWGGFENCGRRELLWETEAIAPAQWKQYEMALRPTQSFTHILLEAEYLNPYSPPYNGNILLDHASPLLPIGCDSPNPERPPLEAVEAPKLEDLRALRAYLAEQGLQLRFTVTGAGIERHLFADAAGNAQQVNKYLWLMGRALSQFPGTEVLIAVGGESDFVLQERLMHFDYTLQAAGLSPQQYHLRPRKRSDEKKEWLWPVEKVDYLIQLVQK